MSTLPSLLGGPAPTTGGPPWDTAGNLINDAAIEIGLSAVGDPFTSGDQNFIQLRTLLKSLGRDLWRKHQWPHLEYEYSFTTSLGVYQYDLPADYGRLIDDTEFNRSNRLSVPGPVSPQEWQYLKGTQGGGFFTILLRPVQGKLWLYPDTNTPAGQVIAFEYISRFWVQTTGNTTPNADKPSNSADTILFDPQLVVRGLKLSFLRAKGFDSTNAQNEFDETLEQVKGQDPAPILNLANRTEDNLLGDDNIPVTGLGS